MFSNPDPLLPQFKMVKKDMARHREELGDTIWEITTSLEVLKEENWTGLVEAEMKRFEKEIIHAMKARGWDGSEDLTKQRWTFPGSLFYSIVLISTIGYGDQTPKTQWGKVSSANKWIDSVVLILHSL